VRSVRVRLLLLVALPMVGLIALSATQTRASMARVSDADRGLVMADAATATTGLVHELERELAETMALRERGGTSGGSLVLAQRSRTDAALGRYQQARDAALSTVAALAESYATADAKLSRLTDIRMLAPPTTADASTDWDQKYRDLTAAFVEVGQALPGQLTDPGLAGQARSVAELTAATHALAQQRDLLRTVLTRGSYSAADQATLAGLAAAESERRGAFLRAADPTARGVYQSLVGGPDVENAWHIRDSALAGDPGLLAVDADGWYVAATHTIRAMHEAQLTLAARLHRSAVAQRAAAVRAAIVALGGSAAVALATVTVTVVLATRVSRRLRRLRNAALAVAGEELPAALDALTDAADPVAVGNARMAAARQTDEELTDGPADEIKQVGYAFGIMHRQALQLAAAQALLRRDMAAIFVALARRNQTLVQRQLEAIDDLERNETDPDTLAAFYKVDHLAARMRRNSENLLLLAGSDPGRSFTTAQSLLDVVRAAAAEITDYARVDPIDLIAAPIAGHAVGDVEHLLAELMENATTHSAPDTRVRVNALRTTEELLLTIYDDGIGMTPAELADANHRLVTRVDLTASLAGSMGLLVVARLAARHEIEVQLRSHPGTGTVALVHLPNHLLVMDDGRSSASIRSPRVRHRPARRLPYRSGPLPGGISDYRVR
jgi:signal transduction histidine kinase